mmetsp:Transcript_17782/g.29908  ORF Transcript_17782/g.29908 Transcript_17782/m.29908 type:complete len:294 (+) Transcript_17782:578-1459(+)
MQDLVRARLDVGQVAQHAGRVQVLAQLPGRLVCATPDLIVDADDPLLEGVHRLHGGLVAGLVLLSALFGVAQALFEVEDDGLALRVLRAHALRLDLRAQLVDLLLELCDLLVQLVHVLKEAKILVFRVHELIHELVDVCDSRRLLDLSEGLAVALHLLHGHLRLHAVLRNVPVALDDLLAQLGLLLQRVLAVVIVLVSLIGTRLLVGVSLLAVHVDELAQVPPLCLEGLVLPVGLVLQPRHLVHRGVPSLVRLIGNLDDVPHLPLFVRKVFFEFLVDGVKSHPFFPQVVDLFL